MTLGGARVRIIDVVRLLVDGPSGPATAVGVDGSAILFTDLGCVVSVNGVVEAGNSGRIRLDIGDQITWLSFLKWGRRGPCADRRSHLRPAHTRAPSPHPDRSFKRAVRRSSVEPSERVAALMGASAATMGLWRAGRGGDRVSRAIRSVRRTAAFDRKVIALFPPDRQDALVAT